MILAGKQHRLRVFELMVTPPRGIRQRVLVEIRKQAQTPRHATQLPALLALERDQIFLQRRRDAVARGDGGIVDDDLRVCRDAGHEDERERE